MRILDSHVHLWDPAVLRYDWLNGRLRARFGPTERDEATATAGEADRAFVFVQAECVPADALAEVDWVCGLAAEAGATRQPIRGIVARLAMEHGDVVRAQLDALRDRPLVVGVRRLIQDEAPGFATTPAFLAAARAVAQAGLVFDACVRHGQLAEVARLAEAVPELPIVLDHLGKPAVDRPPTATWLRDLRALAEQPQVSCKLSGLPAEAGNGWTPAQLTPFLDAALAAFGPDRLLFGSDWPVSWPYAPWERFVRSWAAAAVPDRAEAVLWANAERVYQLH